MKGEYFFRFRLGGMYISKDKNRMAEMCRDMPKKVQWAGPAPGKGTRTVCFDDSLRNGGDSIHNRTGIQIQDLIKELCRRMLIEPGPTVQALIGVGSAEGLCFGLTTRELLPSKASQVTVTLIYSNLNLSVYPLEPCTLQ